MSIIKWDESVAEKSENELLEITAGAVKAAGQILLDRFRLRPPPTDLATLLQGIADNDAAVTADLRQILQDARPGSHWLEDEEGENPLPAGEWWAVDSVEGNINHLHGRPGWGVTATLVRDGEPWLTVIHEPLTGETCTAITGGGAFVNGRPLHVSGKRRLEAAIVATGQARPGETAAIKERMARSAAVMLDAALLVRASVPTGLELVDVATGRLDLFWQYGRVAAGLVGGALLIREAGGVAIDLAGERWTSAASCFVAGPSELANLSTSILPL
ncbi:inositol monophosphatase family protein [Gluconobacter albidus]|uniref:inositol monophosphatase family protein n=1 Tax=Gluconobacter albidus TaxID=318683 RepID=UPI00309BE39B